MALSSLPMPLSSLSMITFYFLLIHSIPSATPLTFNFPKISDHQSEIILANDASDFSSSQGLQLTPNDVGSIRQQQAGRASFIEPLHLWDSASGELVDFTTSFSFVIDSFGSSAYGDGLAFFIAENNSVITRGGAFGLPIDPVTIVPTARFVAVEFDTYWNNGWDPLNSANTSIGDHVGIDISSLHSVAYEKWWSRIPRGLEYEACISYNATLKDLSVVFTGYQNNTKVQQDGLHYTVDLRKALPEWVNFGFSASTGANIQKNNIKSWSFRSSKLQVDEHVG
ncbi:hypothetical protein LguiB_022062 [Lonicera macranthoides]